jgi:3-hydroxybutyryl-CoA dehydrogenase
MIKKVVVAGAGTMGAGIAQVFAQSGFEVTLVDLSTAQLESATKRIQASLEKLASKNVISEEVITILGRIKTSTDLSVSPQSDLFIEAVFEKLSVKADILHKADGIFAPHTLFASNTSGFSITEMSAALAPGRDLIGLHFFNPVPIMKLLEIVMGERTSEKALEIAKWVATKLGKEAIIVRDSPGFATSRLGVCLAFEAIRMLENSVASAEDIDKAMVLGYGHPMGPLKLTDLIGLDVRLAIGQHLCESLGAPQFEPPKLLRRLVKDGKLGQKTGQGFYSW